MGIVSTASEHTLSIILLKKECKISKLISSLKMKDSLEYFQSVVFINTNYHMSSECLQLIFKILHCDKCVFPSNKTIT